MVESGIRRVPSGGGTVTGFSGRRVRLRRGPEDSPRGEVDLLLGCMVLERKKGSKQGSQRLGSRWH